MSAPLDIVIFGLTLSSSWGNGHATTYRALLRGLRAEGHRVLFLECDKPWYASNRDLPHPEFCDFALYDTTEAALRAHTERIRGADAVIVGSYVPDGVALIDRLAALNLPMLAFYDIDTPVTLDRLDWGDPEYIAPRQVSLFDRYLSFSGGAVLDLLQDRFGARDARALYCSVDAEAYAPQDVSTRWDLGYLGTYSDDRQPQLETLLIEPARRLPEMRFVVAGPQFPQSIDWPANVERIDHLPPAEHAIFYSRQRFTLNVTRAAMRRLGWSPSVRLFEAAACGVPIISDRWKGIDDVLPEGEAILIADGSDAVVRALTTTAETRRRALADAARHRVLTRHTGRARARDLTDILRQPVSAGA